MPTISKDKEIAIKIEDISKVYTIIDKDKKKKDIYALNNLSFNVYKGEVIGIIGPNGSGKSTLLKIISEVTAPTSGNVTVYGKVASILEVGLGFNPELTGTENIYLSARLYGMKKQEVDAKFRSIAQFFGFEQFINTPVKQYSSGMYMRLAFALVIHIDADIYLFDEVLSVGDNKFRNSVIEILTKLKKQGKTILFVTHNPLELFDVSDRFLFLDKGGIEMLGDPHNVLIKYNKLSKKKNFDDILIHIEAEKSKAIFSNKNFRSKILPETFEMKFVNNEVQFVYQFSSLSHHLIDFQEIKHYLIICDNFKQLVAQVELKDVEFVGETKIKLSKSLPLLFFGSHTFIFSLMVKTKFTVIYGIDEALKYNFNNKDFMFCFFNLDLFKHY